MNTLIIVSLLGIASMLADVFRFKKFLPVIVTGALLASLYQALNDWGTSYSYFRQMVLFDNYALAFSILLIAITLLWMLMARNFFSDETVMADHFALISFSLAGGIILSAFSDLTLFFIGIEILSVSAYVLAGTGRSDIRSSEAALKYFIPGAFSTGFLLLGIALIYGATGSFNLSRISVWIIENHQELPPMVYAGMFLLTGGMLFKVAAMPFHSWAPDVYDGSPTPVTAFMSTVIKAASFIAFYRLMIFCFSILSEDWSRALAVVAALTMLGGNLLAVYQQSLKRMLAYSSIAHTGYLLMAVAAVNQLSQPALLFYLAAYSVASLGLFTIVNRFQHDSPVEKLKGMGQAHPLLAAAVTILTLSMAGIPPVAGFFGKYYVFLAAFRSELVLLVLIAIAASLIGVYYYFRIIMNMYAKEPTPQPDLSFSKTDRIVILLTAALSLLLGIAPAWLSGVL